MVKKIPERRCVGCNTSRPKKELIRIVRNPEGEVSVDAVGKKSGRGVYLCPSPVCLARACKSRRLEKNLDCVIPDEVYAKLEKSVTCVPDKD